ncbi:MAG: helix-turn-helix transcriptional regulator [Rhodobacter sp.]|nr:helix-turn-helix transcriptional regulator [Rhodobacter sp.]
MTNSTAYKFGPDRPSEVELELEHEIQLRQEEREHRLARCRPHDGLKRIRKDNKRSQAEMANLLGVSRRTYQDFENGKRAIPSDVIALIHGHFDCDLHQLFTGSPMPTPRTERASYAIAALNAFFTLQTKFGEAISLDQLRHYATLTAELTEPGEEPELLWLLELVARDLSGLSRFAFADGDYGPSPPAPDSAQG